jgi:hypothetical protein
MREEAGLMDEQVLLIPYSSWKMQRNQDFHCVPLEKEVFSDTLGD